MRDTVIRFAGSQPLPPARRGVGLRQPSPPEFKTPQLLQIGRADPAAIRTELLSGLTAPVPWVAPKYLYDGLGSRLFSAITELPEYYPTRTEAAIFRRELPHIAAALRPGRARATLVELGAGNCEKAARLFEAFGVARYVAVDISADYLRQSLEHLQWRHPAIDMLGVGLDFSQALVLPAEAGSGPVTLFYAGSSIGNFTPDEALAFLRRAHAACRGGALLIGVDLVKPAMVLEPAYDDPLGVTAAFNRNLLLHFNRLAGTDFAIADWRHVAFFNAAESRIEMHLEAVRPCTVSWDGGSRRFASGDRLHTENSYKWQRADFAALLRQAGFSSAVGWTDDADWFAVFLAFA
jgi:dimethylhistidine N-methyltransferase